MLDGLETVVVRLVVADPTGPVALDVVLDTAGFKVGFGLDVVAGIAAFRVVPRFSANVSALAVEEAREVLRAAVASGFLVSSPDPPIDGRDLCVDVVEDVEAAALVAGFRAANPPIGRVGGLLKAPVVLAAWAAEEAVGFVAEDVDDVPRRLAVVVVGLLGGTVSCFVPFVEAFFGDALTDTVSASDVVAASLTDAVSASDDMAIVSSTSASASTSTGRTSTGDSGVGACGASTSAMLRDFN